MGTSVKICIIGAGSAQFSAGIVRDLCVNPGLAGSHVVLMDIDERRLEFVLQLAERLSAELQANVSFSKTTDRQKALKDADFVLNTAQVGGHQWSEDQRKLGEKHGYYRGTKLHNFPQMHLFLDVARDIERICPNAWLIQSANPVFEGCSLMHRETKLNILGLCHGHYGYLEIANVLGLEPQYVTAKTQGFNHWIWLTDFRYKGEDAYPLLDEWIQTKAEAYWAKADFEFWDNQMSRAAIHLYQMFGLMPIGDTPRTCENLGVGWWYHTDLTEKQRWYGSLGGFDSELGWQKYLDRLSDKVDDIERAVTDASLKVTDIFPPVQSKEQIVPIINSLVNNVEGIYQVNIPNRGGIVKGFPENLVVECQGVVNGSGIRGVSQEPLPAKLVAGTMNPRWSQAECMIEAMRLGDYHLLLSCLLMDQRTRSLTQAEGYLREWFADPRNEQLAKVFRIHP
ncbi:family 4 glycosyl hydrolase [Paenibacillus cremeus]|uniref:Alpha-glucosidase/alpha-galactosidase n=1 Tax=Paenibacillus cremeus TaxID=2163881 RepID=A0A559K5V2_9BACL|nr:alpha-glucosidase/alpha-galactosidase [Paenibacillus cremeus]TVY07509.1 alpha-glucosidase/alpha-galactosidase [Paenibacillus cremeus]